MAVLEPYTKDEPKSISGVEYIASKAFTQAAMQPYTTIRVSRAWTDSLSGVKNSNWRKMVLRHQNATSPLQIAGYKRKKLVWDIFVSQVDQFGRTALHHMYGHPREFTWGNLPDPATLSSSKADSMARERFIRKYREKRTAFQGGVFLGEMAEAVQMIRRPAAALRHGIDQYYGAVKERLRRSKHKRNVVQDTWLEYVFGWRPLIKDVKDAIELRTASPMAVYETIKAGHREILESQNGISNLARPSDIRVWFNNRRTGFYQVSYKGAVGAVNEPPGFPEQMGISWSNVLPTIWELIPYSFLVDYFTNVGRVIDGISTGTVRMTWGSKAQIREYNDEVVAAALDQDYLQAAKPANGTIRGDATLSTGPYQSRTLFTRGSFGAISLGIGDFRFKLPDSDTAWLNIAALAKLKR